MYSQRLKGHLAPSFRVGACRIDQSVPQGFVESYQNLLKPVKLWGRVPLPSNDGHEDTARSPATTKFTP